MPPKKKESSDASAAEPRRSSRVASQPAKPVEAKAKPASKKAPASKKRAAEGEPTANGDASKDSAAEKPASKKPKSSAEKPKSQAEKPTSAAADKPKSNAEKPKSTATKPDSKKAPASSKKPASAAKPKSGKKAADGANGGDIPEETEEAAQAEKEAEASPEAKADTGNEKELEEGDVLPSMTIQDNKGQNVDVSTLCDSEHGLVIFVYPKANTPGCTTQACTYRDNYADFEKLGYKVYGLSADTVAAQDKWATAKEFKYNLLADTKHELLKRLGAFVPPKNIKRSHFIFEKGTGKLVEKKVGVKPADDTKNALSFIQSHHK
ncbi:thioredoxin peroxidase dot5 [Naganishia albida]|nr:thioredoxin peroxidase dot5 [Naganishia albida]